MSESQVKEVKLSWMFRYVHKSERPRAEKVVIVLSFGDATITGKIAGSVVQKHGTWNVHYDSEKSFSFRGAHIRKLDALRHLQQLAGVQSDTLKAQLDGTQPVL